MKDKKITDSLNIKLQCRQYGLSTWQCPHFLFLAMGLVVIGSSVVAFFVGTLFVEETEIVALIVLILAAVLIVIATVIIQSFERLGEANRMKSEFINIVSHQLRSPLSNLKWAIELLMSGRLGTIEENQVEYFRIVKENANRMKELVNDLLVVSKIEQKGFVPSRKPFSLIEVVDHLIMAFRPFASASNVEVKVDAEAGLPSVVGDASQIKLVVENLLDNAIRYIKDKGKINIKMKSVEEGVYFEISDTGVGIPDSDRKYIFSKFFRSGNALKHQTQGSGLGLYITKAVIDNAGGKIGFHSEENSGTTFWFTLPIK
ncbi:MAG: HAMP domain-containing sensor histidine kinase [bacterium]